jgi:vacuolar-type H+-ATPase subunit B/Vma2
MKVIAETVKNTLIAISISTMLNPRALPDRLKPKDFVQLASGVNANSASNTAFVRGKKLPFYRTTGRTRRFFAASALCPDVIVGRGWGDVKILKFYMKGLDLRNVI